jgi:hypothetical protein
MRLSREQTTQTTVLAISLEAKAVALGAAILSSTKTLITVASTSELDPSKVVREDSVLESSRAMGTWDPHLSFRRAEA